jgi:hypothetical protein
MAVDIDTDNLLSVVPTHASVSAKLGTGTTDSPSLGKSDVHSRGQTVTDIRFGLESIGGSLWMSAVCLRWYRSSNQSYDNISDYNTKLAFG